jgi:hypothetical protein
MSNLQQIVAHRTALVEKAARQRAELGAVCSQFQRPAAIFDKGYAVASKIQSHPGIVMGATAALALVLIKRGVLGKLVGVAAKAASFAMPVVRFWLSRK